MNTIITVLRESRLARFLIPAGLILLICGIIFLAVTLNQQDYEKTEAIVTGVELIEEAHTDANGDHVDANYSVDLKYTVDGKEYETKGLEGVGERKVGETMIIYYNPKNPQEITQTKSPVIPIILIVGGIAALVGGIVSAVNAVRRIRMMKEQEREWANGN